MERVKRVSTILIFFLLLWGFLLSFLLLPDEALSHSERRKLEQIPKPSMDSILSTDFMKDLESYGQDQFPLRETFQMAKARFRYDLLLQQDSNGIYLAGKTAVKMEKELNADGILYCAEKINSIYEKYLSGMRVFSAVIPDKHYFAAEASGHPSMDYSQLLALFQENLQETEWIRLFDDLTLEDYYLSDAHWRQECLGNVRHTLAQALGVQERLPEMSSYDHKALYPFSGVYLGQSALPVSKDTLIYLSNAVIEQATVKSAELKGDLSVYAPEKLDGLDGYDVFLHGAQALMTIENPLAQTDRELILFRDSFGSSLAPLLLDAYSKITLIDLRYVSSDYLGELVSFDNQDVLFLYSTGIVNNGRLLR